VTLNGRKVTLAEIKYSFGAYQKNSNEDRQTVSAAKYTSLFTKTW